MYSRFSSRAAERQRTLTIVNKMHTPRLVSIDSFQFIVHFTAGPLRLGGRTQRSASEHNIATPVVFVPQVCYGLGRCPEPEDQYYPLRAPVRVHEYASTRSSMLLRYATNTGADWKSPCFDERKTPETEHCRPDQVCVVEGQKPATWIEMCLSSEQSCL